MVFNKIGAFGGIQAPGCVSMRVNSVLLPQSGLFIKGSLGISKGHLAISKGHLPISKGHLAISNPNCISKHTVSLPCHPRRRFANWPYKDSFQEHCLLFF